MGAIAILYLAFLRGTDLWLISSTRGTTTAVFLLGMVGGCMLSGVADLYQNRRRSRPVRAWRVIASFSGVAAFVPCPFPCPVLLARLQRVSPGDQDDGIVRRLPGAAVAAPSIHNTQPWRFRVAGDDLIEVNSDPHPVLWVADQRGRALHLSCGAALFNLRLTIRMAGQAVRLAAARRGPRAHADRVRPARRGTPGGVGGAGTLREHLATAPAAPRSSAASPVARQAAGDVGPLRRLYVASDCFRMTVGHKIAGVAGVAAVEVVYAAWVRPRLMHWGATDEEVTAAYPGAEIVPHGKRAATMAVTIEAPPDQVWPWLVQMGGDRGGWYSWDRLDNGGRPSATEIHPEWQDLAFGDYVKYWTKKGPVDAWQVAALEPNRFLGLHGLSGLQSSPLDPSQPRPSAYVEGLWGFLLNELPGGRTRLVISGYQTLRPRWLERFANYWLYIPVVWPMQARMLAVLKRNIERAARAPTQAASSGEAA